MRFSLVAFVALFVASPGGATNLHAQAKPGGRCSFAVVKGGPAGPGGPGMRVSGSGSAAQALASSCEPKPPNFVNEDSRELVKGIKLARLQNDSLASLRKHYTTLQKMVQEQALVAYRNEPQSERAQEFHQSADHRKFFLTPEMIKLREQLSIDLRGMLTAEQHKRFDDNAAELRRRTGGSN